MKAAGLIVMYLKCAHPDCSSDFDYGQGRLFRFQQAPRQEKQAANWHAVEHYWLCKRCCKSYTIEYQTGLGVLLLQRLDAIAGGRPHYHVLQAEPAPKPASPRRFGGSKARQIRGTAGLPPVAVGMIEILETRNLERRGKPE